MIMLKCATFTQYTQVFKDVFCFFFDSLFFKDGREDLVKTVLSLMKANVSYILVVLYLICITGYVLDICDTVKTL